MRFRIKRGQSAHRFVFDRTPAPAKPPQPSAPRAARAATPKAPRHNATCAGMLSAII